jgi:hypothetical protein
MGSKVGVFGYLDAGTGSLIASGIAAFGAAAAVVFITFKNKIVGVFSPKRRKANAEAKAAAAGLEEDTVDDTGATSVTDQG